MAKSPAKQKKTKEKPIDPLAHAHVHVREGSLPPLSAAPQEAPAPIGHNSDAARAEEMLNSAIDRLDALDRQIAVLNQRKSDVYAELKALGLDVKVIRQLVKDGKIDPLVLADKERKLAIYRAALRSKSPAKAEKAA